MRGPRARPWPRYTRTVRLSDRAPGYGMPGVTVDGTDPHGVYSAVQRPSTVPVTGQGPSFVEAVAYRLQGHYFGDAMSYADPDELAAKRADPPFARYRKTLIDEAPPQKQISTGSTPSLFTESKRLRRGARCRPARHRRTHSRCVLGQRIRIGRARAGPCHAARWRYRGPRSGAGDSPHTRPRDGDRRVDHPAG